DDASPRPLEGAVVLVDGRDHATTDADGRFALTGIAPGRHTVVVRRIGYAGQQRRVDVRGIAELEFRLRPEGTESGQGIASVAPVVVTATRTEQSILESPLAASVLGREDLDRETRVSLAHSLERLPGVRTLSTGGEIGKPVVRGLYGSRVRVADDGLPIEDYSWSDEDAPSIEPQTAERVEVVRGPASVLYGSDALGGVVNVIPRAVRTAAPGQRLSAFSLDAYGATNNRELGGIATYEGASGRTGWRLLAVPRFAEALHTPDGEIENTGFLSANGEAAVTRRGDRGAATLRVVHYGGEFRLLEAGGPAVRPPGEEEEEEGPERKLIDDRVQLAANRLTSFGNLELRTQFQRHAMAEESDDLVENGVRKEGIVFDLLANTASADLLAHHGRGPLTGTLGLSGLYQASDSRGVVPLVPDARTANAAAFAFEQLDLGRVRLLAGARVDRRALRADADPRLALADQSRDYTVATGDLGVVLRATEGVALAVNAGRAFRAPNLFELFANGPRLGEARYEIGDPTLDPERSLGLDASLRWDVAGVRGELTGFTNRIEDFIYSAPTALAIDTLRVFRTRQTRATLAGAEASVEVPAGEHVVVRARGDYVRGQDDENDEPLPLMPPARAALEGEWRFAGGGFAGAELEAVARQERLAEFDVPTAGYALLHLDAGTTRGIFGRDVRLALRVRNATNRRYRDFLSRYKEFTLDPGVNVVLRAGVTF
ncbi:MAG: TonB-dependent receptor, partial [Gemmatimonadaceae bacterium]